MFPHNICLQHNQNYNIVKKTFDWLFNPPVMGAKEILIIRLMAGSVFFWEGIHKVCLP